MTTTQQRKPRYRREAGVKLRLQERDERVIELVRKHRFLSSEHIAALVPGSRQGLLRRLHLLFHAGYLDRPREQIRPYIKGSEPMVYGLGNKGADLLAQKYEVPRTKVDWTSKNRNVGKVHLEHTLMVANFMVCLKLACDQRQGVELIEPGAILANAPAKGRQKEKLPGWQVKVKINSKDLQFSVVPDKVFGLYFPNQPKGKNRSYFFLEADRSTMPVKRSGFAKTSIYKKMVGYQESWKQKLFAELFGFKAVRVLTITKSQDRVASMVKLSQEMHPKKEGFRMFLFGEASEFTLDNLDRFWERVWRNGRDELVDLL